MRLGNATDLIDRFEAPVFAPKRERICRRWRIIRHQFMQFLIGIRIILFVKKREHHDGALCWDLYFQSI